MPRAIADLVLLAIALGAVSAIAINIYLWHTMSFLVARLPGCRSRAGAEAIVASLFGTIWFHRRADRAGRTRHCIENSCLVIAYWESGRGSGLLSPTVFCAAGIRVERIPLRHRAQPLGRWGL
jgi:hypothetical protein